MPSTTQHERLNLEGLVFTARSVVDGLYAGGHVSARHGGGVEFQDYRAYSPGDDLRGIDWKVFGRTDRYYLRRYRHETDLNLHVALDRSASMGFASLAERGSNLPTKFETARRIAAALLMLVLRQGDRAGLALLSANETDRLPATGGGEHLRRLMAALDRAHVDREQRIARKTQRPGVSQQLMQLHASLQRRGVVVVISDLLEELTDIFDAVDRLRFAGSEVVVMQVLAREEVQLRSAGDAALRLIDPETAESVSAQTARVAAVYDSLMAEHLTQIERGLRARDCDYLRVMTDEPISDALRGYLSLRARRR